MEYNLEIEQVIHRIKADKAKTVCIQLPDGLKPRSGEIKNIIESETDSIVFIWAGSCYGACDVPDLKNVDLLIQWGHSEWQ